MITITTLKWVVPFAQGQVRDHRLRLILREIGCEYDVELIDPDIQKSPRYRVDQPFGQVPVLREDGRPTLFETGAIVLDIAERSGKLMPLREDLRMSTRCWVFAALNSVEPGLTEVATAVFFIEDEEIAKEYRSFALEGAKSRLANVSVALGDREWLVGEDFSVADLMMSSVTKIVHHTDLIEAHGNLAWRDRCFARPAYKAAISEQLSDFKDHGPADMGWG